VSQEAFSTHLPRARPAKAMRAGRRPHSRSVSLCRASLSEWGYVRHTDGTQHGPDFYFFAKGFLCASLPQWRARNRGRFDLIKTWMAVSAEPVIGRALRSSQSVRKTNLMHCHGVSLR
jgi:hypothetical protein